MTFSIAFAAGVTPTKWTRAWAERRPDQPLEVFRTTPDEQSAVLRDGRAQVSIVRLPIDEHDLSLIALYREIPVVVAAKDHFIADADSLLVADLADEHLLQDPDAVPEWRDVATEVREGIRRPLAAVRDMDETMELVAAGVGIVIVPHSIARLHSRKDLVSRPVEDVAESQVSLAWLAAETTEDIEEFIGIVRGRTKASSRVDSVACRRREGQEGEEDRQGQGRREGVARRRREGKARRGQEDPVRARPHPQHREPQARQAHRPLSRAARAGSGSGSGSGCRARPSHPPRLVLRAPTAPLRARHAWREAAQLARGPTRLARSGATGARSRQRSGCRAQAGATGCRRTVLSLSGALRRGSPR
ncbi:LysR family substrate-binding domain-containing protein [Cryobacterium sp. 10C3]|uniref:LysR family substrate-binding domain-containing protein n=1 Tax=Cryobacterium sp. 10C3 TaxID=3048577 RepID=UPI002AB54EF7|nr:LysR family substrate-binding domain-containing protein [Cryobacterium sp. 10C3]MDY7557744.1 LysR family substrate-binding domain-containing protein [Cryobacterium sp. 10C3]